MDELIAAYEEANREKSIVHLRHGIDHSLMIRPEHIEAAKRLGLVAGAEENTAEGTENLAKIYGADEVYKISPIRTIAVKTRRLQHPRQLLHPAVTEETPETHGADSSLSDVLVAIPTASQLGLRIVEMK